MLVKQKFFYSNRQENVDVPLKLKLNGKKTLPCKLSEISWYKY